MSKTSAYTDDEQEHASRDGPAPETGIEYPRPDSVYADSQALPPPRDPGEPSALERLRSSPFLQLTLYYLALIAVVVVLVIYVPAVRAAFFTPVPTAENAGTLEQVAASTSDQTVTIGQALWRAVTTLVVTLGALVLMVPVARVYMHTKRLRYDPSLVRSVIILPIVVAGITVVVKNSIALAFSLAGIVAAVRFRNTLKDPRDAVYVFLALGIGLAAGVKALDVALVSSMAFNFLVLFLWRHNIGSIYGGRYGRTGVLSTGSPDMLVAQTPERRRKIRHSMLEEAEDMKRTSGILLVHATEPEVARHTVQDAFSDMAKNWRLVRIVPRGESLFTLEYVVRLRKKRTPADLVGALDERWSSHVAAAEYLPFRARKRERDDDE